MTKLLQRAKTGSAGRAGMLLLAFYAVSLYAQPDFRIDSSLVVLHLTVKSRTGKLVGDLPKTAFHVYEDGSPQNVTLFLHEDTPVAVGLVVDNSGSMERKLHDVVAAADAFARSSNPEDQMFVVNFNERVTLGLPSGEVFVSNPAALKAAMLQIRANGKTALYDGVATALNHLRESPLQKKVLIVVSDGGDNASAQGFREVLSKVEQSDAVIYTVGLFDEYDTDRNPGVLKQLARVSGGEAFFPESVADATQVLEAVSHDIRNQYTIGYVPANGKQDATYRRVNVRITGPHAGRLSVRTRTGYFAGPPHPATGEPTGAVIK